MNAQVRRSWPQEIQEERTAQAEQQAKKDMEKAAALADAMASAAASIPGAVSDVDMSGAERKEFDALVRQLQFQSRELASVAKAGKHETMQVVLKRIKTTCQECHARFSAVIPAINYP